MLRKIIGALFLATAATVAAQSATVVIEASHGGAGNDLTNTTITVPLNQRYTNAALDTVSTLFLVGTSAGTPLSSVTCYPFRYSNLTGMGGLPFTSTRPSFLSTNTVQVGSLVCNSTDTTTSSSTTSQTSTTSLSSSSTTSTTTTTTSTTTSTTTTSLTTSSTSSSTTTSAQSSSVAPSTSVVVSVVTPSDTATLKVITSTQVVTPTQIHSSTISQTTAAEPSLNTGAAARIDTGRWKLQGMALAGAGLWAIL